jgi:hypothetical protein
MIFYINYMYYDNMAAGSRGEGREGVKTKGSRHALGMYVLFLFFYFFYCTKLLATVHVTETRNHDDDEQHYIPSPTPGCHISTKATQKNGPSLGLSRY